MTPAETPHRIKVLLIDDQPIIGEAVRRMLAGIPEIEFQYCKEAPRALEAAVAFGPTVILQDLVMPEVDGLTLAKQFREHPDTRDIPLIVLSTKEEPKVKAEAFALGASDYLVKFPDPVEVIARIRRHSSGYIHLLERNEAYRALERSQKTLAKESAQAEAYVRSLLPEPLKRGPIRADWRFIPSAQLGGDSFGYLDLDDDRFALFLLDVCGHGVGAALLSVSALNALRSRALPDTDFNDPSQVLAALNRAFPMDQQDGKFFTIWYGVYQRSTRTLAYAGGGHPPALALQPSRPDTPVQLDSKGPMIGVDPDMIYAGASIVLEPAARLFLYSDGVYEIKQAGGSMWPFDDFAAALAHAAAGEGAAMDRIIAAARSVGGRDDFVDDVSIVEFLFE